MSKQIAFCEVCNEVTTLLTLKRCNNCWNVESLLKNYLKNPKGQAFTRSKMPLLDDWVDGRPDAWDYEAVLTENGVQVMWNDPIVDEEEEGNRIMCSISSGRWSLTWQHGCMFIGGTTETIARKAAALFVCLWLRGVSASFADKLMDGYIVFLERQDEIALSFLAEPDSYPDGRPFFRLTRENFTHCSAYINQDWQIIEALNIQPDEEVIVTFRKRKKDQHG